MKILLSDGSALASRQVARLLAGAGHEVGVLVADRFAVTRCTRTIRWRHACPRYGPDPLGWLDHAIAVHDRHRYDLLLPTQEQVAALATAAPGRLRGAVPELAALAAVQDKARAAATLDHLGVPAPPTVVCPAAEVAGHVTGPRYLKRPIGTGSTAVVRVDHAAEAAAVATAWGGEVVVQAPVEGPLLMAQAVVDRGRVVAFAVNRREAEGAGGGASRKVGLERPDVAAVLGRLATGLAWHGALSADLVDGPDGPVVIDVNPRLVEPANAAAAGVDLVGALVDLAAGRHPDPRPQPRPGVRTHQGVLALLGAAPAGRGAVAREAVDLLRRRGPYRGSVEELTPTAGDRRAAVLNVGVAAALVARPGLHRRLAAGSVADYALTPAGWDRLLAHAAAAP